MNRLLALLALVLSCGFVYAQEEADELSEVLLAYLDSVESNTSSGNVFRFIDMAYALAEEEGAIDIQDYLIQLKLTSYHAMGQYQRTIEYADSLMTLEDLVSENFGLYNITMYLKVLSYIELGKYRTAIEIATEVYNESLSISDDQEQGVLKDNFSLSCNALTCIGLANSEMGMVNEAIKNFTECVQRIDESEFKSFLLAQKLETQTFLMLAAQKLEDKNEVLKYLDSYAKAIEEFKTEREGTEFESTPLEDYEMLMHVGYAMVYCDLNETEKAYEHIREAERIIDEYNDIVDQYYAELDRARAKYYNKIGDAESALISAENAFEYHKEVSKVQGQIQSLKDKMDALNALQRYPEIYDVAKRIITLSDTLSAQRLNSSLDEMQTMMEVDKLEREANELENQRKMWILVSVIVLMAAFVGFALMKRHRDKEKQRILTEQKKLLEEEVERQTHELREQRDEIEQKNRDITDSINYAQRIQNSILPDMSMFSNQGIEGAFAFFIPCHIVSGDFYWAYMRDSKIFFACADCTGHGVPGAFMSMIGTTILNDLCKRPEQPSPSEMLELLHINLLAVLQQSGEEDSRDGMDIAIMEYDVTTQKVVVSGARRPVYIYTNGERIEYKAAKRSIGERDYNRDNMPFTQEEYQLSKGDTVYMCSDGLPDQFGGSTPKGKRLLSGGLKRMLDAIVDLPIRQQQSEIEKLYWEWRNDKEQLDDISLVGVRV